MHVKPRNAIKDCSTAIAAVILILLSTTSCLNNTTEENHYTVGIINPNTNLNRVVEGFKEGMAAYGFTEGENISYIEEGRGQEIGSALEDFKKRHVDLVFTITTPATGKAVKALHGTGIPVVFGTSYDPVRGKIVKSLINQRENITGIKVGGSVPKALEWLLLIAPQTRRIFVPVKFDTKAAKLSLADLGEAAAKLDIDLLVTEVNGMEDLNRVMSDIPDDIDAIFILNSIFIVSNLETIMKSASRLKLPSATGTGQYINGVMISYSQDHRHSGKQAGRLAHNILRGVPASNLPVETAEFFLGINLKTAGTIGFEIPYDVLQQADFIVR